MINKNGYRLFENSFRFDPKRIHIKKSFDGLDEMDLQKMVEMDFGGFVNVCSGG